MRNTLLLGITVFFCFTSLHSLAETPKEKSSLEQALPITAANIRGHKALYTEGWFLVSSSEKALEYAHQHSIVSSGEALTAIQKNISSHSTNYAGDLSSDVQQGYQTGKGILLDGTSRSGDIFSKTHQLVQGQLAFASSGFSSAWSGFIEGNINLVERTEEDRSALMATPGNYYDNVKEDFSNLFELSSKITEQVSPEIENSWSDSFSKAGEEFNKEYEKSGEAGNSFAALFYIGWGYMKSAYYGLVKPGAESITTGVTTAVNVAGQAVFLPTASALIITGRTVQSLGQTIYYTTKTGYKVISPTIEGGLLASLSLLSAGAAPVTYAAGTTIGVVNQVAITTAAPVVGMVETVGTSVHDTLKYAGLVTYDVVKGTSKVVLNQLQSGVVLGYNALTALPTQAVMGTFNTAFFLVYDGPRLVIVKVFADDEKTALTKTIEQLPVGTVVNLQQLKQNQEISVQVVSEDPEVINNVLEKLPADLRH